MDNDNINYITLPDSCVQCGACCAYKEAWVEVTKEDASRLSEEYLAPGDIEPYSMLMTGPDCRCTALLGKIGKSVKCTVYENRPAICRLVERGSPKCIYMLGYHRLGRPW